jgi:hypothetical protein
MPWLAYQQQYIKPRALRIVRISISNGDIIAYFD